MASLMQITSHLAGINACCNAASATLLLCGFVAIKFRRRDIHEAFMLSALAASTLFLAGYLTRAALGGTKAFAGHGWLKALYFAILVPHMLLAVTVVPLVATGLYYAFARRFRSHRRLMRWTYPIWMYVSVTGVIVYFMLYELPVQSPGG